MLLQFFPKNCYKKSQLYYHTGVNNGIEVKWFVEDVID